MSSSAGGDRRRVRTRKTWDARADATRDELVEQAIARIVEHGVEGIEALVTPSALARTGGITSVDTAYRLLGSSEATLRLIVDRVTDPEFSAPSIGWPSAHEVSAGAIDAYEQASPIEAALAAFRFLLARNFVLPSKPFGMILDGVAATASASWRGPTGVSDAGRVNAHHILTARQRSLEQQRDEFRWMLSGALAALGRRPKPGMTLDRMVSLMHALADGAVNRMLVWPGDLTVDDVAAAVLELGLALSEDGSHSDPRLPADEGARAVFTRVVEVADERWCGSGAVVDLDEVAAVSGVQPETVGVLFQSVEELADSVVRRRVIAVAVGDSSSLASVALLSGALRRLAETAEEMPDAVQAAARLVGDATLMADLRATVRHLAERSDRITVGADRFAEQLVGLAEQGTAYLRTIEVMVDLLRRPDEPALDQ